MERRGRDHMPLLDHRELGGAAADVDVENALILVMRDTRGARAVGGQHRLHMVAGRGADEFAALLRQNARDSGGVFAPQRLACEDHGAGVDLVRMQVCLLVGLVDDLAERGLVDQLLALIGGQRVRGLIECFTRNNVVAAGEVLAIAAQIDAREDHLGAGRADIDADAHQRHMVLQPDRILL